MYLQNHSAPPEDHEELTTELFEAQPPAEDYTRIGSHNHHQAVLDSYDTGVTQLPVTGQDSVDFDH